MMNQKYKTILADPPWNERGSGRIVRGAQKHYPLMKTEEIIQMRDLILELASENCHLYLWTTNNFLEDALTVLKSWGFRYVTMITWLKAEVMEDLLPDFKKLFSLKERIRREGPGLGQYFRGLTEHCIFGVRGSLPYRYKSGKRAQGTTIVIAPRRKHSEKPKEIFPMIEEVSYPPRVELFSRRKREGWCSIGITR